VSENEVSVSVSDTGLGIPLDEMEKVFDEFYRSERIIDTGVGGIGLGLAITKQLVEAHGGRIGVRSPGDLGCGSTFTFTLPTVSPGTMPPDFREVSARTSPSIAVLIEKDESSDPICNYLWKSGFQVNIYNVDEEKDWLLRVVALQADAVVLGTNLASSSGWSIAEILKRQVFPQVIPVFTYSLDQQGSRGEFLELNYLEKPIQAEQLSRELSRILSESPDPQTVLIVDDDPVILEVHRRLVVKSGRRAVTAINGREALEKIAAEPPDLILLDLVMPEMDGFAVLDALHAMPTVRHIPVIILTGHQLSAEDIDRCNRGVASILSKGVFSAEETLTHIDAALTHQSSLNSATRQLIRKSVAIIHARYTEPLSRDDIAAQLNISADYLTDCFRQEFGITPTTFLRRYRIKQACDLLLNSDLTITRVAMNVGFSDSAHFTHTFIREMGISPRAFRSRSKKQPVFIQKHPAGEQD